jgi:hypothetical protein
VAELIDRALDERQIHARLTLELARALDTDRVDVVLLNHAPIELAYAVIAQGEVLYQRDLATRVEYEAYVMGWSRPRPALARPAERPLRLVRRSSNHPRSLVRPRWGCL